MAWGEAMNGSTFLCEARRAASIASRSEGSFMARNSVPSRSSKGMTAFCCATGREIVALTTRLMFCAASVAIW